MNEFCAIHGHEPIPQVYYKICAECWHCYVTEDELIIRDQAVRLSIGGDTGNPRPADQIAICPLCTHDF